MEERSDCDAVLLFLYCCIICAAILLLFFIILCVCCCKKKKTEVKEEGIEVPPLPVKPVQDQERNASESEEADVSNPFHRDEEWAMSDDASSIGKSEQDESGSTGALNPFSQEVNPGLTLARAPETVEVSPEPKQDVAVDVEERPTPLMPSLSLAGFGAMTGTSATVEYPLPPPLPAKPVRQSSSSSEEGVSRTLPSLPKPVLGQSMELSSPMQESSPLSPQHSAEPLQLPPSRSTEPPQPSVEPPRRSIQPPPRSVKPPQLPPPRRTVRPPTRISSSEDDSDDFMPTPPRRSVQPPPRTVDTPFGPVSIARPSDASFPSSSPPRRSVQPPSLEPARPTRTVRPPPTAQPDVTLAHPTRSAPTPSASDRLSSRYSKPLPSLPPKPSRSVLPPSTAVSTSPSTAVSRNASSPTSSSTLLFSVPEDIAFPTTTVTSPELQQLSNAELEEEKSFMRQLSHPNILRVGEHEAAES